MSQLTSDDPFFIQDSLLYYFINRLTKLETLSALASAAAMDQNVSEQGFAGVCCECQEVTIEQVDAVIKWYLRVRGLAEVANGGLR